jgi:spermidine synthase
MRAIVLLLTVATGFAGLVYEVTWQRYLAVLLGAHSEATAVVLAWFLGGLAGGYAAFGALARRLSARLPGQPRASLLAWYGGVEVAIGAWAIAFPVLFELAVGASLALPAADGPAAFVLDAALAALLIVPPALLMGATIPLLTQALSHDLENATRWHAAVYGANTLGAFGGALLAGFWLLPAFGFVATIHSMAAVNITVGLAFLLLARAPTPSRPLSPAPDSVRRELGLAAAALLFGFAMMSIQTTLVRLGSLALGPSQLTFSIVVAVFVLSIALGALAVSAVRQIPRVVIVAVPWALLVLLGLLYVWADAAPWAAHALRSLFRDQASGFPFYQAGVFALVLVAIGPAVVLSGAILPLLFHALRRDVGDLGRMAGRLYAWNTVGSLLGALLGGYALLYWLDLHHVFRLALAAIALGATLVSIRVGGLPRPHSVVLATTAMIALVLLGPWSRERLSSGVFRIRQPIEHTFDGPHDFFHEHVVDTIVSYDDDPVSTVVVKESKVAGMRDTSLVTNGKGDGSLVHDYGTMALAALIPAALAERCERAFVIGWGTGVSAGELAALESMREVVVAEISPAVVRAAPLFAHGNLDAAARPEVKIIVADAYRVLRRTSSEFDVIVSEPSHPWALGVEMIYSREFLEVARDHLAPGGIHVQWMHLYESNEETLGLVLRTYLDVFDEVSVWYGLGVDVLLLGHRSGDKIVDLQTLEERVRRPDFVAGLARVGIESLPALLAHEILPRGVLRALALRGDVHTLLHPRLGDRAARAFFTGAAAHLPASWGVRSAAIGAESSIVGRYAAYRGGTLDEAAFAELARETSRHRATLCLTLLARWAHAYPKSLIRTGLLADLAREPSVMRRLHLERLAAVRALYEVDIPAPAGVDPLVHAQRTTDLFYRHYHHAVPFPRESLEAVWQNCSVDPDRRSECDRERKRAEVHLGPLEAVSASAISAGRIPPR